MFNIMCVTNRGLCEDDFLTRIEDIASHSSSKPSGIILREKDLTPDEYKALAMEVMKICETHNVPCILHSFVNVALQLGVNAIHVPLPILRKMDATQRSYFATLGASCHSVEDAMEAQSLGCTYITAGHIFATHCKKGLEPRGLDFLENVCKAVSIPVYAIGGINKDNLEDVKRAGASGACIMSGFMQKTI